MSLRTMLGFGRYQDQRRPEGATHILIYEFWDFDRMEPDHWKMWGLDFEGEPVILHRGRGISDDVVAAFASEVLGYPAALSPRFEIKMRDGGTQPLYYVIEVA